MQSGRQYNPVFRALKAKYAITGFFSGHELGTTTLVANMLIPHKESAAGLSTGVFNHVLFDFSYEFMIKQAIIISFALIMNLTFFVTVLAQGGDRK